MKYGKEFQHILDASDFPDDWKTSAIEYRKLKKLIKNVQAELEGMGLSPAVLRQLLVTDSGPSPSSNGTEPGSEPTSEPEPEPFEFEFEHDGPSSPKEVQLDPVFDSDDDEEAPVPTRFRVRVLSDSESIGSLGTSATPISVADLMMRGERGRSSSPRSISVSSSRMESPTGTGRVVTTDGVTAQYVFTGDESSPVPQIRLSVHPESLPMTRSTSGLSNSTHDSDTDPTDLTDTESDILDIQREPQMPASPALLKMRAAVSPIWALASTNSAGQVMVELNLGEAAAPQQRADVQVDLDATPTMRPFSGAAPPAIADIGDSVLSSSPPPTNTMVRDTSPELREFIIPLQSDMAFFNVLTAALTSLSRFHAAQQEQFHADVEALCKSISESITPGDTVTVLPTPLNSGPGTVTKYEYKSVTPSQKDLYAWRDIFALWVEAEIFESSSERNRGERTIDEAERRLQAFAAEVVRRRLGDRRTIRGKRTRKAWEDFLKLNVRLLDLKRFQLANINAARKILKKHDKRTALTASTGLAAFVRSTVAMHVDPSGNVSTWTFYNTSLPHVLLARMTDTLLPILPSLDDFACLICMSIAFKPIRLTCGHLFCVRCLVKMQQRGNDSCPLCRKNTVLLADRACLDVTLMNFMKDWFPREVRTKQLESTAEIARESIEDAAGIRPSERDRERCVVM
ncbi:hypothetical protein CspeluHIS016_0207090 [Cutaneotrichosporon spelunceum]|uniref:SPX-domain-containing protein n=1 Tax=Cutaneotrichosporon spelunceum TaxID=1672016 RepID=A0AAD3TS50_9TREE|nr:hypothetical protein CspeluHIS016_0207090 [Cutaneotrichosporon spelunceum]